MPATTFPDLDALKAAAVGTHLGYSGWHEITQEQVNLFAQATGDHQWIHVDVERATAGPFGGPIAHGYLTLALLPMLVHEVVEVGGVGMGINYGLDKVRLPAPVPVGAKVRAGVELMEVKDRARGFVQLLLRVTVEIEGGEKPAVVAESRSLYAPA